MYLTAGECRSCCPEVLSKTCQTSAQLAFCAAGLLFENSIAKGVLEVSLGEGSHAPIHFCRSDQANNLPLPEASERYQQPAIVLSLIGMMLDCISLQHLDTPYTMALWLYMHDCNIAP